MMPQLTVRVLLVEDSPSDALLVKEALAGFGIMRFQVAHVERIRPAMEHLSRGGCDVVLLDLGLPDSQGLATFVQLHQQAPDVPVLVLTALDDEALGMEAMQAGAQDYLVKKQIQSALLGRAVRFAIERLRLQRALEATRNQEQRDREFSGMERLSVAPGTAVTAQYYGNGPLRESAPQEFNQAIDRYLAVLDAAFEQRLFKTEAGRSAQLHRLGLRLASLRAGPRDVVEIHTWALKTRIENENPHKSQAYVEEGRLAVLELMGQLAGTYRSYAMGQAGKESTL